MGVGLALCKLDQALLKRTKHRPETGRLVMLGPIIHNPQVLAAYAAQGVIQVEDPKDVQPGDTVIIRAHGIPRDEEQRLEQHQAHIIDATCPKVKQAQLAIAKATEGGIPLYLFGEKEHPEVKGLISYEAGPCSVFGSLQEIQKLDLTDVSAGILAAQTTQERLEFEAMQAWLSERISLTVLTTICDATRKRQKETQEVAQKVAGMIVVGGRTSGNTRRLGDVARSCGIPVWAIETAAELPLEELRGLTPLGITAGASTPKSLIDEVQKTLEQFLKKF